LYDGAGGEAARLHEPADEMWKLAATGGNIFSSNVQAIISGYHHIFELIS
jgi:hypothetical protein